MNDHESESNIITGKGEEFYASNQSGSSRQSALTQPMYLGMALIPRLDLFAWHEEDSECMLATTWQKRAEQA